MPGILAACGSGSHPSLAVATQLRERPVHTSRPCQRIGPLTKVRAIALLIAVNLKPQSYQASSQPRNANTTRNTSEKRLEHELMSCTGGALGSLDGLAEASSKDFKLERSILRFSVNSEVASHAHQPKNWRRSVAAMSRKNQRFPGIPPRPQSGGPRNRTSSKGFGDPHVTVTPVPQKRVICRRFCVARSAPRLYTLARQGEIRSPRRASAPSGYPDWGR
jgi:hypothetical protein